MAINDLTKPFGLVSPDLQPTLGPITPPPMMPQAPQVIGDPLSDKNRQLAIMLYGLGSALKGGDPVQAGLGLIKTLEEKPETKKLTAAVQDYEYYSTLPEAERLTFLKATGRGAYSPELADQMRKSKAPGGIDVSAGQKVIDSEFAKGVIKWQGGEQQQAQSNITNLKNSLGVLMSGENVSGPEYALTPESLRPFLLPQGEDFVNQINDIVFQSLKATLGAQFTEREAKNLVAATFNQSLDEDFNLPRLQRLIAKIEATYIEKQNQIDYFNEAGTLKGYEADPLTFDNLLDSVFHSELENLTNEQIIPRYQEANTQDEKNSILRFAELKDKQNKQ